MEFLLRSVASYARGLRQLRSGFVLAETNNPGESVEITAEVIGPDDLAGRLRAARSAMVAAADEVVPSGFPTLAARADRLHRLWATVSPPTLERGAGLRGAAASKVKRALRQLLSWYVEPRWVAQREIDAENARFASEVAVTMVALTAQVEQLQILNNRLQRDVHKFRQDKAGNS